MLRLEALWWMTRPSSLSTGLIAIPGWLAATSAPSYGRLSAMVGAIMAGRAISNIVNDILDEEKDRVTAPELPLPSGMVTIPQAALMAGFLTICLLVLLWIAGGSWTGFLMGVAGISFGGAFIGLYSFVKPNALVAMAVTGCVYLSVPVTAWFLAGGSWSPEVGVVFIYALLRGLAANVFSTLRDVDLDAAVGNYSVAVRLGATRAFALGVAIEVLAAVCVFCVAILLHHLVLGLIVVATSLALFAFASLVTVRHKKPVTEREGRSLLIWQVTLARNYAGIVLVQSVPVGLVAVTVTAMCLALEFSLYKRRVMQGDLYHALAMTAPHEKPSLLSRET